MDRQSDTIIDPKAPWLIEYTAEFDGEVHIDYDEQHVFITCLCGEELELYDHRDTLCECGRVYELETRVRVRWAADDEIPTEETE